MLTSLSSMETTFNFLGFCDKIPISWFIESKWQSELNTHAHVHTHTHTQGIEFLRVSWSRNLKSETRWICATNFVSVFPAGCNQFDGPHTLVCLQNVFEDVGCTPMGEGSPMKLRGTAEIDKLNTLNLRYDFASYLWSNLSGFWSSWR